MKEEEIRSMGTEDLYQIFSLEVGEENKEIIDAYPLIRFGINIKFDIYDYFGDTFIQKTKGRKVKIGTKSYDISELYTEIERRTVLMKKILISINKTDFPYHSRGINLGLN